MDGNQGMRGEHGDPGVNVIDNYFLNILIYVILNFYLFVIGLCWSYGRKRFQRSARKRNTNTKL